MRLPQISLRTALWITALVAVALGWFVDRQQLEARLKKAEERLAVEKSFAAASRQYTLALERKLEKELPATH
jgi:hypothetical protein